jgi:NDP-sugar pyrophosphorylase family protein
MKAVILAAGKGTRLKPLTDNIPKALVKLKSKPLLEHVLLSLKNAGINNVIIVVGYLKEKIISYFGNNFQGIKIEYVVQEQQLGTGNAILQAEKFVKEDFLVSHCDTIPKPIVWKQLIEKNGFDAVLVVRKDSHPERFGVIETRDEKIVSWEEKPKKPKSNLVNAGFLRFSPSAFEEIKKTKPSLRGEIELTDAVNAIAKKSKASFVECFGKIIDISDLEDLKKAEEEK